MSSSSSVLLMWVVRTMDWRTSKEMSGLRPPRRPLGLRRRRLRARVASEPPSMAMLGREGGRGGYSEIVSEIVRESCSRPCD